MLSQLHRTIPDAVKSIEKDIMMANRDKAILGIANFLGSEYDRLIHGIVRTFPI